MKWDEKGLAVAIAQNVDTGAIMMQGFANRDALATTISSRKATFYSRSRSLLWTKGETSMNFINVHDVFLDCDRDSVSLYMTGFEDFTQLFWMRVVACTMRTQIGILLVADPYMYRPWEEYSGLQ